MQMNKEEIPIDLSEIERREDVITVDVPVRLRLLQPSMIQLVVIDIKFCLVSLILFSDFKDWFCVGHQGSDTAGHGGQAPHLHVF